MIAVDAEEQQQRLREEQEKEEKLLTKFKEKAAAKIADNNNASNCYSLNDPKPALDEAEIEAMLKPSGIQGRSIYEIKSDKRLCCVCHMFETWNLELLRRHLTQHLVYKSWKRWDTNMEFLYQQKLQKRSEIRTQILQKQREQIELERDIERFEKSHDCGPLAMRLRQQWIAQILSGQGVVSDSLYGGGDMHFGDTPVTPLEADFMERKRAESEDNKDKSLQELLEIEAADRRMRLNDSTEDVTTTPSDTRTYVYKHTEEPEKKEEKKEESAKTA